MPAPVYTQSDLLALWRSLFPVSYTEPLENEDDGFGLDVYAQQAAQFARVSEAVAVTTQAYYLRPHSTQIRPEAQAEARATGELELTRSAGTAAGAVTVGQGERFVERVRDSRGELVDGVTFRATADATLAAGSLGPVTVAIEAERPGYQGNLPAERVTAFLERGRATVTGGSVQAGKVVDGSGAGGSDRLALGMIGQYVRFTSGANATTVPRRILSVTQGSPSVAEVDGTALTAGAGDFDVVEFADLGLLVTQPAATSGGRHGWLDAIGLDRNMGRAPGESDDSYRLRLSELPDVVSPGAINRIAARALTPLGIAWALMETREPATLIGFVWDLHAFDFGDLSNGIVLLDEFDAVRFFILRVGIGNQGEFGFAFDNFPGGAWDWGFFDGYPVDYYAALGALYSSIEQARAGGVRWELVRDATL